MFAVSPVADDAEDNQQFLLVVTVGLFTAYEKALHVLPSFTQAARHTSKDPVVNESSRTDMSTRPTLGAAKHTRAIVGWAVGEVVVTVPALVIVNVDEVVAVLAVVLDELEVVDNVPVLVLVMVEVVVAVLALVDTVLMLVAVTGEV